MDAQVDLYAVLGLRPQATPDEIKTAYRVLVRRLHPDARGDARADPQVDQRFLRVQQAYEILSDAAQRRAYDRTREAAGLVPPPALVVDHTLSYRALPRMEEEQVVYALVRIAPHAQVEHKRLPFNLCLVVDRSTSMQGVRLQRVKEAVNAIIDNLEDQDVFSLVTFSDRAQVVIEAQPYLDKAAAKAQVRSIRSAGGTEILHGLRNGLEEIHRWCSPERASHLVLLTDGQTYGDEDQCVQEARAAGARQITITTIGIGQDWNDQLMDEIARQSGGTSHYIDSASRVTASFRSCIHTLSTLFARDLALQLHSPAEVQLQKAYRVAPYMESLDVGAGTLGLGHLDIERQQSLMLQYLVRAQRPGRMNLADLMLEAVVPSLPEREQRVMHRLEIEVVEGLTLSAPPPPHIISILGKLAIFEMQEKTMRDLAAGELEQASHRLETMATRLLGIGENELAKAALLEAGRLSRTGSLSPEGRKRIRYGTRSLSMLPKEVHGDQM
jgi:Ca-activated chloride channel family protein